MVESVWFYATYNADGSCPLCHQGKRYVGNGVEYTCPKCGPIFRQEMKEKKIPPALKDTGVRFDFDRWAVLRRAEADAAESGWSLGQARTLVDSIIKIWVDQYTANQRLLQQEQAAGDTRRATIASRSTY